MIAETASINTMAKDMLPITVVADLIYISAVIFIKTTAPRLWRSDYRKYLALTGTFRSQSQELAGTVASVSHSHHVARIQWDAFLSRRIFLAIGSAWL